MEVVDKKVSVGDWVEIVNCVISGCTGFVLSRNSEAKGVKVQITRNQKGEEISGKTWLDLSQIIPYSTSIEEDDLYQLIDMALDTGDEAWFEFLTNRLPLSNF